MKEFRAYVYSEEVNFGNIPVKVQASFPRIKCESEDEAKVLARLLVRALMLFPEDVKIWTSIASENKPDPEKPEQEEG